MGLFGVGGSVPIFNLEMGLPLKVAVACSEAAIALGDAAAVATYLSAGFRPDFLVSTQVGVALGALPGWLAAWGRGGPGGVAVCGGVAVYVMCCLGCGFLSAPRLLEAVRGGCLPGLLSWGSSG